MKTKYRIGDLIELYNNEYICITQVSDDINPAVSYYRYYMLSQPDKEMSLNIWDMEVANTILRKVNEA